MITRSSRPWEECFVQRTSFPGHNKRALQMQYFSVYAIVIIKININLGLSGDQNKFLMGNCITTQSSSSPSKVPDQGVKLAPLNLNSTQNDFAPTPNFTPLSQERLKNSQDDLSCPVCEKRFNLSTRLPIMHQCCKATSCLECWELSFTSAKRFKCKFNCRMPAKEDVPVVNSKVKRLVEGSPLDTELKCEEHQERSVTKFNLTQQRFMCEKCEIIDGEQQVYGIDRKQIEKSLQCLRGLLDVKMQQINKVIEGLDSKYITLTLMILKI